MSIIVKEVTVLNYVLETNGITKKYKNFKALNGLTMHVPSGSIYGLVGKNGSGKTTLMRIISSLQAPTDGDFTLYGRKNTDRNIQKSLRRMGAVIETPAIYLDMTAKENMLMQYKLLGIQNKKSADEILELVGLSDTGKKKAKNFSLGMRQRLGIAIALAGNPDFLVLDEPINGLDPEGIVEVRELILKLNRERGITFLISSHILDELARIATHFGFLDSGHLVKEISREELENACRKCMRVTVSDTKALVRVLDGIETDYKVISDGQTDIFGSISVTKLVKLLENEGCELISVTQRDESLESYFMGLVGGMHND